MNVVMTAPWEREDSTGSGALPVRPAEAHQREISAWMVAGTSGWAALGDHRFEFLRLLGPGTTSGWQATEEPPASQTALAELRSRTQLTWAQLARALQVQRRSLHFWAQGERPSASNLERLMGVVGIVRSLDQGDPARTTSYILEPLNDGLSPYVLLCEGRESELQTLLSKQETSSSSTRGRRRPPQLSKEERRRRAGLSPVERLVGIQDDGPPAFGPVLGSVDLPDETE